MTEYDYSPEAYERFLATQNRIARWVDTTERHRDEFQAPFGPGGLRQQQRPPLESHSSRSTPTPSSPRHRDRKERRPSRHHGGYESSDSGSNDSREYGPGPGPMPRGLHPATGHHGPHQHPQQYQPMQMQQQYASPHVQIYGAPAAPGQVQIYGGAAAPVALAPAPGPAIGGGGGARPPMLALPPQHLPQHQVHASYSYAGAGSPPLYGYPGYPMAGSPPLVSSSSRKSSKSKSKRSRSHQPTPTSATAGAALAAYYAGAAGGYTSPPITPGYQYAAYGGMSGMSSPAATGGGSVMGGYFVPQQYPPMVPMMYRG